MTARVLVAGIGNVFLGDDGFGSEVARVLASETLPDDVKVEDFGIRGLHLAYEIVDGYERVILVDTAARGDEPGSVSIIEPELPSAPDAPPLDAHGMCPEAVLGLVDMLGGTDARVVIVGCEPASLEEGMGLSAPVVAAVPAAVATVRALAKRASRQASGSGAQRPGAEGAESGDRS